MRRLTRVEYDNSVRDLLGQEARAAEILLVDEAVDGFESNSIAPITQVAGERYAEAAQTLAGRADLARVLPCQPNGIAAEEPCARRFIETFGRRAFRRPVSTTDMDRLLTVYREKRARSDFAGAVRLVLAAILQAPSFLYRSEVGVPAQGAARVVPLTGHEVAARLSFFLWASTVDDQLLAAAESGALGTRAGVEKEARRLLGDPRALAAVRSFHRQWLELAHLDEVAKDPRRFPEYTPALRAGMTEEAMRFSEETFQQGPGAFATSLTAEHSFVDASLARLYGVRPPVPAGFARTVMPAGQRSGVLTMAGPLSVLSFPDQPSPIHRGKFVRERIFCQAVPLPPPGVDVTPPQVAAEVSTRDRFAQHRRDPVCASCHELMDPIGLALMSYDAIGRWQTMDGRFPVDARGELTRTDADGPVTGASELGRKIAGSAAAARCLAEQWLRFALGRGVSAGERCLVDAIGQQFLDAKLDPKALLIAVATSDLFRNRRLTE